MGPLAAAAALALAPARAADRRQCPHSRLATQASRNQTLGNILLRVDVACVKIASHLLLGLTISGISGRCARARAVVLRPRRPGV